LSMSWRISAAASLRCTHPHGDYAMNSPLPKHPDADVYVTLAMGVPMTTIRTTCEGCGDVELSTSDIALELTGAGAAGSYRFSCPTCSSVQVRPATRRVVSILLATGVNYEIVLSTAPITESEIDDFIGQLAEDDWISKLVASES